MVRVVDNKGLQIALDKLRDPKTDPPQFRSNMGSAAFWIAHEALQEELLNRQVLVPILRAGLGMLNGTLDWFPKAGIGHLGIERRPDRYQVYFNKLPSRSVGESIYILDPMLATGGSASLAASLCRVRFGAAAPIHLLTLLCAPEGIDYMQRHHPDVTIWTASIDDGLDDRKYIVPGLGDAGDRLYGTEH